MNLDTYNIHDELEAAREVSTLDTIKTAVINKFNKEQEIPLWWILSILNQLKEEENQNLFL